MNEEPMTVREVNQEVKHLADTTGLRLDGLTSRMDTMVRSQERTEAALVEHGKTSQAMAERFNTRSHERMDKMQHNLEYFKDDVEKSITAVKDDFSKKLNSLIFSSGGAVITSLAVLALALFNGWLKVVSE